MTVCSPSWEDLKPRRSVGEVDPESPADYVARLKPDYEVPREVAEQWLFAHYENEHTVTNYAWMDYRSLEFALVQLSGSEVSKLTVISPFVRFVAERSTPRGFEELACRKIDVEHWRAHGTWRVPPVVLSAATLRKIPPHAEIRGPYQLVEGHSRLGNFFALGHAKNPERRHWVYLLRARSHPSAS